MLDLRGSESLPADFVESLAVLIPQVLDGLGPFKSISSQEIKRMLALESMKQSFGCDDVGCLAEIGGALGADLMISGSVNLIGGTYLLQLQLMNTRVARVESRVEREYKGGPAGMLDEVRTATKILVRDVLASNSGTVAFSVSEEGATIRIDGSTVGSSPCEPMSVAGGVHTMVVEKEGFIRFTKDVTVRPDETASVAVTLRPSADFLESYERSATTVRTGSWIAIGVGAVGLVGSAALFFVGQSRAEALDRDVVAYNQSDHQDAATLADLTKRNEALGALDVTTLATLGVGLVALGAGAAMRLLGDDPGRYQSDATPGASEANGLFLTPSGLCFTTSF